MIAGNCSARALLVVPRARAVPSLGSDQLCRERLLCSARTEFARGKKRGIKSQGFDFPSLHVFAFTMLLSCELSEVPDQSTYHTARRPIPFAYICC